MNPIFSNYLSGGGIGFMTAAAVVIRDSGVLATALSYSKPSRSGVEVSAEREQLSP